MSRRNYTPPTWHQTNVKLRDASVVLENEHMDTPSSFVCICGRLWHAKSLSPSGHDRACARACVGALREQQHCT